MRGTLLDVVAAKTVLFLCAATLGLDSQEPGLGHPNCAQLRTLHGWDFSTLDSLGCNARQGSSRSESCLGPE